MPLQEFVEWYSVREAILPDSYCLQHASVSQLFYNFLLVEETRTSRIVRFYATHELWWSILIPSSAINPSKSTGNTLPLSVELSIGMLILDSSNVPETVSQLNSPFLSVYREYSRKRCFMLVVWFLCYDFALKYRWPMNL